MALLRIIGLCIVAAVAYGIVHDQITARLCIEYFTIGHVRILDTESPTVLGLVWGVVATWWVGLLLGVPLALAARLGSRPRLTARDLVRPIAVLLAVMGVLALVGGIVGHALAAHGIVELIGPIAQRVPAAQHVAFIAALWAHSASYAAGFVGGVVLIVHTIRRRRRVAHAAPAAPAPVATAG